MTTSLEARIIKRLSAYSVDLERQNKILAGAVAIKTFVNLSAAEKQIALDVIDNIFSDGDNDDLVMSLNTLDELLSH